MLLPRVPLSAPAVAKNPARACVRYSAHPCAAADLRPAPAWRHDGGMGRSADPVLMAGYWQVQRALGRCRSVSQQSEQSGYVRDEPGQTSRQRTQCSFGSQCNRKHKKAEYLSEHITFKL